MTRGTKRTLSNAILSVSSMMPAARAVVPNSTTQRANFWLCSTSMAPARVSVAPTVDGGGSLVPTDDLEAQPATAKIASNAGTSQQRAEAGKRNGVCIRSILVVLWNQGDLPPSAPPTFHCVLVEYGPTWRVLLAQQRPCTRICLPRR